MRMLFLILTMAAVPALASPNKQAKGPDWTITGWEVTTCCCNDICPCRFNEKPTNMECESFVSVHIDKGMYGTTKLSDVNFIIVSRGLTFDGTKGWSKIYFDDNVSMEEQKAVGGNLREHDQLLQTRNRKARFRRREPRSQSHADDLPQPEWGNGARSGLPRSR